MAQSILSGPCIGGPLDGERHTQRTTPPTVSGVFNHESLANPRVRGTYTFKPFAGALAWVWTADPVPPQGAIEP